MYTSLLAISYPSSLHPQVIHYSACEVAQAFVSSSLLPVFTKEQNLRISLASPEPYEDYHYNPTFAKQAVPEYRRGPSSHLREHEQKKFSIPRLFSMVVLFQML